MSEDIASDTPPPVKNLFATTWEQRQHLLGWDLAVAVIVTAAGTTLVKSSTLSATLPNLLIAEFGLIGAVLGVVVAGLAIVVAFLSREYAVVLDRDTEGPIAEFWPFWFVAAIAASAVVCAGAGLIVAEQVPCARRAVFGVTTFLSVYAVAATVNLVAFVAQQGVTRAWQLARRANPR
ncbi:hypothetical protein GKE82_21755 [Conexibacter sp. W3-3-2]|uniref:hypothetical protein n=1 Tax=Conexibacter sp. W3-3-2 TaxID=2675227 RepID=UPI0012B882DE|nr:hypothetical protein [Conexibacter sp. W3-3-2]MTD46846.1 hypothetical protein [Conexibacter sp. W3-3-2]